MIEPISINGCCELNMNISKIGWFYKLFIEYEIIGPYILNPSQYSDKNIYKLVKKRKI